ncbi:helix-turn-helix transcriptional regulator [Rubrivivax albus]|uniref:AlpA family phage regulatory protein n=1 Tax=Rubrivivax albus TaxID=2499835 RepID=A0A3S2WXS6_9BURK|nr:AlpA family phage regulatory protein [Rubrivivax albus]RVT48552.1 AlpA family phage regulatory protein [Rubrivivax albus]
MPHSLPVRADHPAHSPKPPRLLRKREVLSRTGLSDTSLYRIMSLPTGGFPRPLKIAGGRTAAWIEAEVDAWIEAQIETRSRNNAAPEAAAAADERVRIERKGCTTRSVPVAELPPELQRAPAARRRSEDAA